MQYSESLALVRDTAATQPVLETEFVSLEASLGRVASNDIVAEERIPPYDNSAVDGFAMRSEDTRELSSGRTRRFPVLGTIIAGDTPPRSRRKSGVWEIMTGAPFPPGLDASVKVEDVRVRRDDRGRPIEIELEKELSNRENLRGAGEDFFPGRRVIYRGTLIGPEHILALAALGVARVPVFRPCRLSVLATGRELATVGEILTPGKVRDSTGPFLRAVLAQMGVANRLYGKVGDDPREFISVMERIIRDQPDVILTTGAVSMGIHDFVTTAIRDLGGEILFHKVAIRPGKPILFARFPRGPVVFGLPGNPVSTVVGTRFFVEPYLRALTYRSVETAVRARLKKDAGKPEGLRCFFKAKLEIGAEGAWVTVLPGQPSFMISPLLASTAWAVLPEKGSKVPRGEWIDVFPVYSPAHAWSEERPGIDGE
jgi:molybdopterin molybdotransferase